jgi:hypothetical protein
MLARSRRAVEGQPCGIGVLGDGVAAPTARSIGVRHQPLQTFNDHFRAVATGAADEYRADDGAHAPLSDVRALSIEHCHRRRLYLVSEGK